MKQFLLIIAIVLIISSLANAESFTLADFPRPFVDNGVFNAILVVGDYADALDVIGVSDIAMRLQYDMKAEKRVQNAKCDYTTTDITRIQVGAVQLASQISDRVNEENLIIVGGPCINSAAAMIMGHPDECTRGFSVGKAKIKLYEHNNGKFALLVAGRIGQDTRAAAKIIANYEDYKADFKGTELVVAETSSTNPTVAASID
ncbi:hypothetical protein ACFLYT_01405 [Nanoarchaeota archaeon]